jgi:hypothetical protein
MALQEWINDPEGYRAPSVSNKLRKAGRLRKYL